MKRSTFVFLSTLWLLTFTSLNAEAQRCATGKVDTKVAAFLKMMPSDNRTVEELKKTTNFEEYRKAGPPVTTYPVKDVQRIKITADSIPVLVFNPAHSKGLPIIVQYHGGGFIQPLVQWMEYYYWLDAKTFNAVVFAVDYRVAPEDKFPAGFNDSYNAFKWISENGSRYGGDTSKVILKGESAGANFVAAVCLKAKQEGIAQRIKLQVMNSPVLDNTANVDKYPSMQQNANGYFLSKADVIFALETYVEKGDYNNPLFAPLLAKDLSYLPPAVIITAEFDPLRDQGFAYAEQLRKAGVRVWHKCFPGQIHVLISDEDRSLANEEADKLVLTAMKQVVYAKSE
jgi:acetyl esterase